MADYVKKAEFRSRRRSYLLLLLALMVTITTLLNVIDPVSTLSHRKLAWEILIILTALNLTKLPFSLCARPLRDILNDEMTQHIRLQSLGIGFWGAIISAASVFWASDYVAALNGEASVMLVTASSLVSALITYSALELRAIG